MSVGWFDMSCGTREAVSIAALPAAARWSRVYAASGQLLAMRRCAQISAYNFETGGHYLETDFDGGLGGALTGHLKIR